MHAIHAPLAATALAAAVLLTLSGCSSADATRGGGAGGASAAAPATQDERMAWWREARFGMFVHWGLYAIPAGEWNGNTGHGEWIRDTARIPVSTYEQFRAQWNPVHFDADAWASLAAAAGMKYLVVTSKHHDGFCLWDSAETDWDVGATQLPRDVLGELAAACARHGVRFCTYHSIMDWHHPDYLPRRPWEAAERPAGDADFERFERYLHAQVREIVERHAPAVMWFDGEWESTWSHERGVKLFSLCRDLAPAMIVNNRVDVHRGGMAGFSTSGEACGDFATPEQEIPATGIPGVDWESCMTMNRHWGWNRTDTAWKSTAELVRNLVDIASKGGNYLLNVGPRADGTFPPEAVERLQGIAAWMRVHGESIHGTTASLFDHLPFGRCTVRRGDGSTTLYFHVFDWPADAVLRVPGLGSEVAGARLLANGTALRFRRNGPELAIELPGTAARDPIDTVVAVEIAGEPIVHRAPRIEVDWPEFVGGTSVVVEVGPGLAARYTLDGSSPTATSPRATGPIEVRTSCELRAAAFQDDVQVSDVVVQELRAVGPWPALAAAPALGTSAGLRRSTLRATTWDRIPPAGDDAFAAGDEDVALTVGCGESPGESVAMRFSGTIDVPATGLWRFALRSDDGSRLRIDGRLVVDNDGLHGAVEQQGAAPLARGKHAIEVVWFNKTGGADLALRWARPGEPFAPVPPAALRH